MAVTTTRGAETRRRILDAASELFRAQALREVSADRVIELAGVSKVTFYRHFRTKDALVIAYLDEQADAERALVEHVLTTSGDDAGAALDALAQGIGAIGCLPGYRGCAFLDAAAEYGDPAHPVHVAVATHRAWLRIAIRDLLVRAEVADPERAADAVVMLRDGALAHGTLVDRAHVASTLAAAFRAVAGITA